jgi:predicted dehydrogenase
MRSNGRRLRGALIGCGFFGRIQHEAWKRIEGVEIVAACDPILDRARALSDRAFADAAELLRSVELDFVDVATRPDSHLPLLELSAARNIPAICQKPLGDSFDDGLAIIRLSERASAPIVVHENWRWQPWFREAKRLVDLGAIGKPICYHFRIRQRDGLGAAPYPNQPYFREMPRLHIHETLVHSIDTARFFFGDIRSVHARIRRLNPAIRGEDRAVITLTHLNEVDGIVDGHRFLDPDPPGPAMGETTLEGDEAKLRITAPGEIWIGQTLAYRPPALGGYKGDSARAVQLHFIECLRTGEEAESSVRNYWNTFAAVEAAYESSRNGAEAAVR